MQVMIAFHPSLGPRDLIYWVVRGFSLPLAISLTPVRYARLGVSLPG